MSSIKPALIIISDTYPSDYSQPGSPRLFALAREWSIDFELILIYIPCENTNSPQEFHDEAKKLFSRIIVLEEPPKPFFICRLVHKFFNAPHFIQTYKHPIYTTENIRIIKSIIQEYPSYHLHVNYISNAQYIPKGIDPNHVTIDVRDDPTLLHSREVALSNDSSLKRQILNESSAQLKYLKKLQDNNFILIMVGKDDQDNLRSQGINSILIPNGVDLDYYHPRQKNNISEHRIIFSGVMDYGPNVDAILFFTQQILPHIKEKCPAAELIIVGANPAQEISDLQSHPGITVTGRVDDIRPYFKDSSVFICPMRSGAGIKNKVLVAMAIGCPIVSTSLGTAGVEAIPGTHYLLADDPIDFANAVIKVLENESDYSIMTDTALDFVKEFYSWKNSAKKFKDIFLNTRIS